MELFKNFLSQCIIQLLISVIPIYSAVPSPLELCAFRRVCKGKFGKSPSYLTAVEFGNMPCYCDEDCIVFGDCCYDSAVKSFSRSDPSDYLCAPIPGMDYNIYVKRQCNTGWRGDIVRNLCETPNTEETLSNVYVTSLSHGTTYGNIFCAVCNGEKFNVTDLKVWEIQVKTPIIIDAAQISSSNDLFEKLFPLVKDGWTIDIKTKNSITGAVVIVNNIPPDVDKFRNLRRCKMIVDNCAGAWFNPSVEQRCKSFNHYVYDRATFQLYKNIYCAVCNFVTYENLRCLKSDILGINDEQATNCPPYHYFNVDKNMCMLYPFLLANDPGVNIAGYDPTSFPITSSVIHNCPIGHSLFGLHCLPDVSLM